MKQWIDPVTFDLVSKSANGKVTRTSNLKKIVTYIKGVNDGN